MKTYTFKTSLKCSGCVSALMPFMNELNGVNKWDVNLEDENKILTVSTDNKLDIQEIINTVTKAGYTAEPL